MSVEREEREQENSRRAGRVLDDKYSVDTSRRKMDIRDERRKKKKRITSARPQIRGGDKKGGSRFKVACSKLLAVGQSGKCSGEPRRVQGTNGKFRPNQRRVRIAYSARRLSWSET